MIVSTAWLAEHAKDPNVVILYGGDEQEFAAGHIPGARYVDFIDPHYLVSPEGASETLPVPDLEKSFAKAGVTNDSHVIVYFTGRSFSQATKVYFALDALGMGAQTSILDGGFQLWKTENRPTSTEIVKVVPTNFKACATKIVATLDYVKGHLDNKNVKLVDARDADIYAGVRTPSNKKAGHIPGAVNIPYAIFFDAQGRLLPRDKMAAIFADNGAKKGDVVVPYCHIGQQAGVVYFVARYLGFDARLFSGSWEEWSDADLPAEVTKK
jgi:thiosulfate/3-mercaptopyruvate sulfurtransferase